MKKRMQYTRLFGPSYGATLCEQPVRSVYWLNFLVEKLCVCVLVIDGVVVIQPQVIPFVLSLRCTLWQLLSPLDTYEKQMVCV